tara:strand:+ start:1008 stop:1295 length:288 start_codon:yes stop_codon:yes gene_type:complete
MSDTILNVVEIAYGPDGLPVVHIDGWSALDTALLQNVAADGKETYMATSDKTPAEVAAVKLDIQNQIAAGASTPVTKTHLDDLGLTAAVLAWAQG